MWVKCEWSVTACRCLRKCEWSVTARRCLRKCEWSVPARRRLIKCEWSVSTRHHLRKCEWSVRARRPRLLLLGGALSRYLAIQVPHSFFTAQGQTQLKDQDWHVYDACPPHPSGPATPPPSSSGRQLLHNKVWVKCDCPPLPQKVWMKSEPAASECEWSVKCDCPSPPEKVWVKCEYSAVQSSRSITKPEGKMVCVQLGVW